MKVKPKCVSVIKKTLCLVCGELAEAFVESVIPIDDEHARRKITFFHVNELTGDTKECIFHSEGKDDAKGI